MKEHFSKCNLALISVVSQAYDVKFWEEYVLRGNAAILKCQIPSFVSEYVSVNSWIISEGEDEEEVKIDETANLGTHVILQSAQPSYPPLSSR